MNSSSAGSPSRMLVRPFREGFRAVPFIPSTRGFARTELPARSSRRWAHWSPITRKPRPDVGANEPDPGSRDRLPPPADSVNA